jgi:hypothetical protein
MNGLTLITLTVQKPDGNTALATVALNDFGAFVEHDDIREVFIDQLLGEILDSGIND